MTIEIGQIKAIFRYPVKSMAGEQLDSANLGWHGLDGDRRFAFRRIADKGGFPWLTAKPNQPKGQSCFRTLEGEIVDYQYDQRYQQTKYVIYGETLGEDEMGLIARWDDQHSIVIITVFRLQVDDYE